MRRSRAIGFAAVGVTFALVATGCSGSSSVTTTNPTGGSNTSTKANTDGSLPESINAGTGTPVKGGTLHMLGIGDVDYMDPNIVYYTTGSLSLRLWSRQLLTYPPSRARRRLRRPTSPPSSRPPPTAASATAARPTRSRFARAPCGTPHRPVRSPPPMRSTA